MYGLDLTHHVSVIRSYIDRKGTITVQQFNVAYRLTLNGIHFKGYPLTALQLSLCKSGRP